jgi:hypothetical protein
MPLPTIPPNRLSKPFPRGSAGATNNRPRWTYDEVAEFQAFQMHHADVIFDLYHSLSGWIDMGHLNAPDFVDAVFSSLRLRQQTGGRSS